MKSRRQLQRHPLRQRQRPPIREAAAPEQVPEAPPSVEDAEASVADENAPTVAMSSNSGARKDFEDAVLVSAAEPARAMAMFERAARTDPRFVMAWHNAGVAAERQGKLNAAVAYYAKALEQRPDYHPSLYNLVQIYRRLGRAQDAVNVAQRAVANVRNASTLAASSTAFLAAGKVSQAEAAAKQALKSDEKHVPGMLALAEAFYAQRKYELSRFVLNNATAIEPRNALVLQALGRAYLGLKNKPAATKNFEAAVALRQDLPESYNNLAMLYYESGDFVGAAAASSHAIALAPTLGSAWLNRGNALRAEKRYLEAIAAYQKAAAQKETQSDALYNLGILYLDNELEKVDLVDRLELAIKHLQDYKGRTRLGDDEAEKLEEYLTQAQRLRDREAMRRERDAKRKIAQEEKKKREATEAKAKAEAESKAKAEAESKAKAEAEARAKAEQTARLKAEAEAKAKAEAEAKAKTEAEAREKAEQEALNKKIGGGGK